MVKDILSKNVKYIIGPRIGERLLVYVAVFEDDKRFEDAKYIDSLAKMVKREIENSLPI